MVKKFLCFFIFCCLSTSIFANVLNKENTKKITRVIYITLDGTRWQDVFVDRTYFPKLWNKYAPYLTFYGQPDTQTTIEVASVPISLPSYQSQMSGAVQPCQDNSCGRILVETVTENLVHQLGFNKRDVVMFASWPTMSLAVESVAGTTYANAGNAPVVDPDTNQPDEVMADLNAKQAADHDGGDRYDKYTFAQALHYLEKYQPRFMWISFLDADAAAHHADLNKYHQTLAFYDEMLDTLFTTLQKLNLDPETLVIVTTDHGRGNGDHWTGHGPSLPESKQTWGFVMNGELKPISQDGNIVHYNTLSVRPTIEAALGLK